jgi:metal-sulfur cluster biosynthetic enzyme
MIKKKIINQVLDPELGVGVVDLGLIYDVKEHPRGTFSVTMTLTSMGCPLGPQITAEIENKLLAQKGVKKVKVEIVWDPPWNPGMMNPGVKAILFGNTPNDGR